MTQYSGYTAQTGDRLLLDAGAFYKNYDLTTMTGTLLGATKGGGSFEAKPTIRSIEVDGVKGKSRGLSVIDSWDISITANLLEITSSALQVALATGVIDTATNVDYDIVTAKNTISLTDYISNITWVGGLSGSAKPVVIQIFNALSTEGIKLTTGDKAEAILPITFVGHFDATDLENPPFKVYYPKIVGDTTAPTVTVVPADQATGVAVTANIVWTFSEAISPASVTSANFFLVKTTDGSEVPGTLTLNTARTVVTLDPTSNLTPAATQYIATVTKNVKDMNGNYLAANVVVNFLTA